MDDKMTQRYSHHCPDSLRDGVEILEFDYNGAKERFCGLPKLKLSLLSVKANVFT